MGLLQHMTDKQLNAAGKQAQSMMDLLEPVFIRGDIDEEQFKRAVVLYADAVIIRARIKSSQTLRRMK